MNYVRFTNDYQLQDLETLDLEDFKYNSVNITAFRIVDVDHSKVKETLEVMEKFQPMGHAILNKSGIIQVRNYKIFCHYFINCAIFCLINTQLIITNIIYWRCINSLFFSTLKQVYKFIASIKFHYCSILFLIEIII